MPDRPYVQDVSGACLTYSQAFLAAARWAEVVRRLGVREGDRVATLLPTSCEAFTVWMGTSLLRASEVAADTAYVGAPLRHVLQTSGARCLIISADHLDRLEPIARELPLQHVVAIGDPAGTPDLPCTLHRADDLLSDARFVPSTMPEPWDLMGVLFTSGTTGHPKGVLRPWAQSHATAMGTWGRDHPWGQDDCFYFCGSNSHMGGKDTSFRAAMAGARVVLRPQFKTSEFWDDVERHGVTVASLVGPIPTFLMNAPGPRTRRTSLRYVQIGPVPPDVDELRARFGVRVWTGYGQTETPMPISWETWDAEDRATCGTLRTGYPYFEARIVDDNDIEVPDGTVGQLIVRSGTPWTMNVGYLDDPAATCEAWRNGWFHTGDAMLRDERGRYYFVDRLKERIRRRGENISSLEVETAIRQHASVADCAVIGVPADDGLEDEVKAVVVPASGSAFEPHRLHDFLVQQLPRFMVPRFIEVAADLPRTPRERVRKSVLRETHSTERCWDALADRGDRV